MKGERTREIVVELERTEVIRKRARTTVSFCEDCWRETDFIAVADAARLFGLDKADFFRLACGPAAHIKRADERTLVCTASIIARLHGARSKIQPGFNRLSTAT